MFLQKLITTTFLISVFLVVISCGGDKKSPAPDSSGTRVEAATSQGESNATRAEETKPKSSNRKGKLVYKQYCTICHGARGNQNSNGATDLTKSTLTLAERIHIITTGKGTMTPYKDILSKEQIQAVAEYLDELK